MVLNSHLRRSFNHILEGAGSMESEWAMLTLPLSRCLLKAVVAMSLKASCGSNRRTRWWTPEVKVAVKLKKETYRSWLACGTSGAADSYQQAKSSAARTVTEGKTQLCEDFGEAMEQDFQLKKFCQTVWPLRGGKQNSIHAVFSVGRVLLTSTVSMVQRWKEYFDNLLNPTNKYSEDEAEPEDFGLGFPITGAEDAGAVVAAPRGWMRAVPSS